MTQTKRVIVRPVSLHLTDTSTHLDGGGTATYAQRRKETDIAQDLEDQLNAIDVESELLCLLPASNSGVGTQYLAIYRVPVKSTRKRHPEEHLLTKHKQDPILAAREQALKQLERSGGADMADAVRRSMKPPHTPPSPHSQRRNKNSGES